MVLNMGDHGFPMDIWIDFRGPVNLGGKKCIFIFINLLLNLTFPVFVIFF